MVKAETENDRLYDFISSPSEEAEVSKLYAPSEIHCVSDI